MLTCAKRRITGAKELSWLARRRTKSKLKKILVERDGCRLTANEGEGEQQKCRARTVHHGGGRKRSLK